MREVAGEGYRRECGFCFCSLRSELPRSATAHCAPAAINGKISAALAVSTRGLCVGKKLKFA
jgi:hypothetical protein